MKWSDIARALLPALALIPGVAPVIPVIAIGINEADAMTKTTGAEQKQHVINLVAEGAAGVDAAQKKIQLPQDVAVAVANDVFETIDNVKAIHDANAKHDAVTPTPVTGSVQTPPTPAQGAGQ